LLVQPLEAGLGILNRFPVFLQDQVLGRMLKGQLCQPARVHQGPRSAAGIDPPVAQEKGLQMLALLAQVRHCRLARPHQLAHGLMPLIRHPDGGQLAGPVQPGQGQGIPAVGLDTLARALGDQ
jgi:hypothetical protein